MRRGRRSRPKCLRRPARDCRHRSRRRIRPHRFERIALIEDRALFFARARPPTNVPSRSVSNALMKKLRGLLDDFLCLAVFDHQHPRLCVPTYSLSPTSARLVIFSGPGFVGALRDLEWLHGRGTGSLDRTSLSIRLYPAIKDLALLARHDGAVAVAGDDGGDRFARCFFHRVELSIGQTGRAVVSADPDRAVSSSFNASTRPFAAALRRQSHCVRRPSNFASPPSVANQVDAEFVCAIACARSEGNP